MPYIDIDYVLIGLTILNIYGNIKPIKFKLI